MFFKTDMADERVNIYKKANNLEGEISGINCDLDEKDGVKITRVKILNLEGEKVLNKPIGNYITIDLKKISNFNDNEEKEIIDVISKEIKKLVDCIIEKEDEVLVVGLGNENLIADALGSKVIENTKVSRHIKKYFPEHFQKDERAISAIAPGVMGLTGIETIEIIKGIVQNINPKLIIAVDSLASKNVERINKSIQISDTGIVPGSGVENTQKELNQKNLKIPVIAIGIPTVIESSVIVSDAINLFIEKLQEINKSNEYLDKLKSQNNYREVEEMLKLKKLNLIVTPKEIDEIVEEMAFFISSGINNAL